MKNKTFWARFILSITSCIALFWWIDWGEVGDMLGKANGYWLVGVYVIIHMDRLFMASKWRLLLRCSDVPVSTITTIQAYYVGSFWADFLPSTVGADAVRIMWLTKKVQRGPTIIASVVIERLLGVLALGIVALCSLAVFTVYFELGLPPLGTSIWVLFLVSIMAVIGIFSQTIYSVVQRVLRHLPFEGLRHTIHKLQVATMAFKEKPVILSIFLILSIFEQTLPIAANFMMAKALSIDLPLIWLAMGIPIILAVSRLPISVHGFGVQEGAFALIFASAGVPMSQSVMMSVMGRVLGLLATLPGAWWTTTPFSRHAAVSGVAQDSVSIEGK